MRRLRAFLWKEMATYRSCDHETGADDERLRCELGAGERLLWVGRPPGGLVFEVADLVYVPFSLLFLAFTIFWEGATLLSDAPLLFVFWGVPFIIVALHLTIGRFIFDAHVRGCTVYGVTSQRVLIVEDSVRPSIRSLSLRSIVECRLVECRDGSGEIAFGKHGSVPLLRPPRSWTSGLKSAPPTFFRIRDARAVYDLIREAQHVAA